MNLSRLGDRVATRPGGINKTIRSHTSLDSVSMCLIVDRRHNADVRWRESERHP